MKNVYLLTALILVSAIVVAGVHNVMNVSSVSNYDGSLEQGIDEDLSSMVDVSQEAWHAWGVCATNFAPAITTEDGREAQMMEKYEETTVSVGEVMYQTISGLENGNYAVELYANALYTDGRGFASNLSDGATDVVYVSANGRRQYVTAHTGTSVTENGSYTIYAPVTDGTLRLAMTAEKAGTNWHTIQIKSLRIIRNGTVVYAKDATRTTGSANPVFDYWVSGKSITGIPALSCAATESSPVGSYVISVQQGTINSTSPVYYSPGVLSLLRNGEELSVGKYYYLYNVGSGKYYTAGNAWGTQCSVGDEPLVVQFTYYEDGDNETLLLRNYVESKNGWYYAFFDSENAMFVDRASQANYGWIVKEVDGYYRLQASESTEINPTLNPVAYPDMYVGLDVTTDAANTALSPFLSVGEGHYIDWLLVPGDEFRAVVAESDVPVSFINDANHPWNVEGTTAIIRGANQSNYYAASWLTMSYNSSKKTELSFEWAEYNYSYHESLQVYIDGIYQGYTNNSSYTTKRFYLDAGNHIIAFRDSVAYYNYTNNWSGIRNIRVKEILPLETAVLTANSKPLTFTNDDTWPWTIENGYIQNTNYDNANSGSRFSTSFTIDKTSMFSFNSNLRTYNGSGYTTDTYYSNGYHYFKFFINGQSYMGTSVGSKKTIVALEPGEYTVEWIDTIYDKYDSNFKYYSEVSNVELSNNWIEVETVTAGSLGVEVLYKANVLQDVEMLKVTGPLNATDWTDLRKMKNLVALDLSEARFDVLPDNVFSGLYNLSSVILPEGLTSIGQSAFVGTQIYKIVIPSTVVTIGSSAFQNTRITEVLVQDGSALRNINGSAFYGCSSLKKVTFLGSSALEKISNFAFYGCSSLQKIEFASEAPLVSIGRAAFHNCSSLQEFLMPNTVKSVGDYAFYNCSSLKSLVFSDILTYIDQQTCYNCKKLENLHLPVNLGTIYYRAFYGTSNLKHLNLPQSLNTIYYQAFYGCGVDSLLLPTTLRYLSNESFSSCSNLKYIELPSYLQYSSYSESEGYISGTDFWSSTYTRYHGYYSNFTNCGALQTVVCRSATPPSITSDPFASGRSKSDITLKVPSFAVVNYKLDSYWYMFGSIEEGDDIDYWMITSPLSLTNNRRMQGKPDVDLYYGGQFVVGGNAPMEMKQFNMYVSEGNPGRLLNTCEAMSADSINTFFSVNSETWYFFTPLHDVDLTKVTVSNDASYVFRYYDGSSRATNGTGNSWRNVDNGVLYEGQGYIFRCNTNAVITFPAEASVHVQLFNTNDVTKQLTAYETTNQANKSWNYVGNPYPCYYDIYYMDFTAPITVWTGSTYKAYSIVDDNYALRPMQSFFVQKPDDVDNIVFHKEGRQLTSSINHLSTARSFRAPAQNARCFFDLQIIGDEMMDETRVVINNEASANYEIERDASKFMSFETTVPQLFTIDSDANGYAINERPLADGKVKLGYYVGQSGFHTISAIRADGDVYLYDAEKNKTVNLNEQDYTFYSDATNGTNTTRFILLLTVNDSEITGIETIDNSQLTIDNKVYDLQGRKILPSAKKGLYIQNGRKVVK